MISQANLLPATYAHEKLNGNKYCLVIIFNNIH